MKKNALITLTIIISGASYSQKTVSFGIEAKPTLGWISSNTKSASNTGAALGIGYGISFAQMMTENWGYNSGLSMNHITYKIRYRDAIVFETFDSTYNVPAGSTTEYHTQSIELPLGLIFKSRQIGYLSIIGHAGLLANYNIKSKVTITSINVDGETAKKEIHPLGASYYFGTGIYYSLGGSTAIKAILTFSNGLTDLTNDRNHREDQINTYRLGLSIGLTF